MEEAFDADDFVEQIHSQKVYEHPLESGQYLGFFIPGEQVVLRKIEKLTEITGTLSCSVRRLLNSDVTQIQHTRNQHIRMVLVEEND